ncbi:MAG: hypothetical protein QXU97_06045 [Fervidicoccaceae archaeon]
MGADRREEAPPMNDAKPRGSESPLLADNATRRTATKRSGT